MHCFEAAHRGESVWVVFAEYSPAGGQGLLVQLVSTLWVTELPKGFSEVVHRPEGLGVILAQHSSAGGEGLLV